MDEGLWDELLAADLNPYLFLEEHPSLLRTWVVTGEDKGHLITLSDVMSQYGTVSIWGVDAFIEAAESEGYEVIFMDNPSAAYEWRDSLSGDPGVEVESGLEGRIDRNGNALRLVRGFLPFQAQGINFMKTMERGVYYEWSTGTGKTLAAEGTILWKMKEGYDEDGQSGFDLCLYVVKPHNMVNTQRKLIDHTSLDSMIVAGTRPKREKQFLKVWQQMEAGEQPILIFNAEKFNEDKEGFMALVEDRNLLVIFDEMPTKYANRSSALYRNTCEVLYTSFVVSQAKATRGKKIFYPSANKTRASQMFCVGMSATPIRNTPLDVFNEYRIIDPLLLGSVSDFMKRHAGPTDQWGRVLRWHDLDFLGSKVAQITHSADKETDPEIAAQFPKKMPPEVIFSPMDKNSEFLYRKFESQYDFDAIRSGRSLIDWDEILAAIGVLQMICSNPRSVLASANEWGEYTVEKGRYQDKINLMAIPKLERNALMRDWDKKNKKGSEVAWKFVAMVGDDTYFTDRDKNGNCVLGKMNDMREAIEGHDGKVVIFTAMNESLLPLISEWFDTWGITHVCYHGGMTPKQKQEAYDAFREDPEIQVFLSSDAGQDSLDLPEASLTGHYDWPWTWSGVKQRENRQDRIDSLQEAVRVLTWTHPNTIEDRKAEIVVIKRGYHYQVYGGEVAEQSDALAGKAGFIYILTGDGE